MKFYYQNISGAALTYSGTATTGFPVSNLMSPDMNTIFKDTSIDGEYITIDLGTSRTCNYIVIGNCQVLGADITVSYSTDGSTYTSIFQVDPPVIGNFVKEFGSVSARYWKLTFESYFGVTSVQIANIYLGEYFETASNEEFLSTNESEGYGNNSIETQAGYVFTHETQSQERRNVKYLMGFIDSDEYQKYVTMKENIKPSEAYSLYPFYYINSSGDMYFARHYGKFVFTMKAFDIRELTLNLIDEL